MLWLPMARSRPWGDLVVPMLLSRKEGELGVGWWG